jgi:REP element-mobilizing transposase RayT
MPRPPRVQIAAGLYHVTARGNVGAPIHLDDHDRRRFLDVLEDVVSRFRWLCHTYCLMSNHFHLLVTTPSPSIASGMQRLNGLYAQSFNRRHSRKGHLFEGRYAARIVASERHLLESCRYIVFNPVRAELCGSPADWPWSSYRALAGLDAGRPFLAERGFSAFSRTTGGRPVNATTPSWRQPAAERRQPRRSR